MAYIIIFWEGKHLLLQYSLVKRNITKSSKYIVIILNIERITIVDLIQTTFSVSSVFLFQ